MTKQSKRAPTSVLEELHNATTNQLLTIVTRGVPVITREGTVERNEDGSIVYVPAAPAYFAQAVKLLKDNGIEALPEEGSPLGALKDALPIFNDEDADESDLPIRPH